jgi:hypothetical protein
LVFALTDAVPAVIAVPSDVDAVKTVEFVFEFTALVIPAVAEFVFALITAARDVEATPTRVSVFELTAVVTPDTSD